jgi:hypothetical protein
VSSFRAAARPIDPDGQEWEIYSFRVQLRGAKLRHVRETIRRAYAAYRADDVTIEAITYRPHRETHTWKTTREHERQILIQVEGALERGYVPKAMRNATYAGWSRSDT